MTSPDRRPVPLGIDLETASATPRTPDDPLAVDGAGCGVDDVALTVDHGRPFYICGHPHRPAEYGLPPLKVNRCTFDRMPVEVQALYERREAMPGVPSTAQFVRVRRPATRWVPRDGGWTEEPLPPETAPADW